MNNYRLRGTVVKLENRLSDSNRQRLHFFLGDDVPRRIRDDPSLGGTLSLMESLFDQDKINEQNFTFLINAFDEIQCIDAVHLLKEHMRRIQTNDVNQSLQSLASIMPSTTEHFFEDEEDDKYATKSPLITQRHRVNSIIEMGSMSNRNENPSIQLVSHQTSQSSQTHRSKTSLSKWMCLLLLIVLLLILVLIAGTAFIRHRSHRWETELKIKDDKIRVQQKQINAIADKLKSRLSMDNENIQRLNALQSFSNQTIETLIGQLHQLKGELEDKNTAMEELKILRKMDNRKAQQLISTLQQSLAELQRSNNSRADSYREADGNSTSRLEPIARINIRSATRWKPVGITVAGGNGEGKGLDSLNSPFGLDIDVNQTLVVADHYNHRIIERKPDATSGQVLVAGNGPGGENDQLNHPTDVILNREADCMLICDRENQRIVKWSRRGGRSGTTVISTVKCFGLTMDDLGFLYVTDLDKHEVRRWGIGDRHGALVAGGNGPGPGLDQLDSPHYVFVDHYYSVYVSDSQNHRVMKWIRGASEGIVLAGGQGDGGALMQLSSPEGIFVDQFGSAYVADCGNNRVSRWGEGARQGTVIVGGNGYGKQANQLNCPMDLTIDLDGSLYVVDSNNNRVQKFSVDRNP